MLLTVNQAAQKLRLHPSRIRQLILAGELPARKYGNAWLIEEPALLSLHRSMGRPHNVAGQQLVIYCDGAAYDNPHGHGGWGLVAYRLACKHKRKERLVTQAHGPLPKPTTNNEAEYAAVTAALRWLTKVKGTPASVLICSDSDLVVNQINGEWNCNADNLRPLLLRCKSLLSGLPFSATMEWVPREVN